MNVLFDLDGTLTDPKEGIIRSVRYAVEKMGVQPPAPEKLEWLIGPPLQGGLARILKSEDPAVSAECLRHYRERFSEVDLYENFVYPGIPELLASLRDLGLRLYVATSKPTIYATQILEHFEIASFFEAIYGSELDGTRTHKVELLTHLIEQEELAREQTVMVGDREHDVLAAVANGVYSIGVLYGYGCEEELLDAGVDVVVESPKEVFAAVSNALAL